VPRPHLILLHPPSILSFRERPVFFGPVSDVIPSTSVFELYPIGFLTLSEYLHRHGIEARIINLALRMLRDPSLRPETFLAGLDTLAFGIDLHWLPHADGSLGLAEILKRLHPRTPVIMGGLSASYFREEIMSEHPSVDFVVSGDSTEEPLRLLMEAIRKGGGYEAVPNLSWRDRNGSIITNDISWNPGNLDYLSYDYSHLLKSALKYRDPLGYIPFKDWPRYPVSAVFSCRGCCHNCASCGGSISAFRGVFGRETPCFRSPELLARDIQKIAGLTGAPVMVIGDLFQAGNHYAERFLKSMREAPVENEIALEFFLPPPEWLVREMAASLKHFNVEISPESHDPGVRAAFGKHYDNGALEDSIECLLRHGCRRVDLFFMVGLPRQDYSSVMETAAYSEELLKRFGGKGRLLPMVAPLAPFIDPGSMIFEEPERFGYRLFCRTLEEHRQAMLMPSWKDALNYETAWMSRDDIAAATYEAALRLIDAKAGHGILPGKKARAMKRRIVRAIGLMRTLDARSDMDDALRAEISSLNRLDSICDSRELRWRIDPLRIKPLGLVKSLLARGS